METVCMENYPEGKCYCSQWKTEARITKWVENNSALLIGVTFWIKLWRQQKNNMQRCNKICKKVVPQRVYRAERDTQERVQRKEEAEKMKA